MYLVSTHPSGWTNSEFHQILLFHVFSIYHNYTFDVCTVYIFIVKLGLSSVSGHKKILSIDVNSLETTIQQVIN